MKAPPAVVCAVWLACLAYASASLAAETELRAASFQPAGVSFAHSFYRWIDATNERCADRVKIAVVGPAEVRSELQWHELKNGRIDMYYGPANYYRGQLPQADLLNLARNDPAEQRRNGAWALLNALHNEHMNAWYLTSLSAGVRFFIYTTKPAEGGRFEGFRIRAAPLYDGFLRTLGAEPRFMPASEVEAALENGEIDGFGWPLWSGGLGWEAHVKFRYGPGFLNAESPILVNLDTWHALSEAQRQCLTDMAVWVEGEWPKWRAEEDARQLQQLRQAGIEYVDLGPAFARKPEDIYWGMLEKAEPELVQQARPLFAPTK